MIDKPTVARLNEILDRPLAFARPTRLAHDSRRKLARLKKLYTRNNQAETAGTLRWLCDNYYVLEKETKLALRELRGCGKLLCSGWQPVLFCAFLEVFGRGKNPVTEAGLTELLAFVNDKRTLPLREFDAVPLMLKLVFLDLAHDACTSQTGDESDLSHAVKSLIRMYSVDFDEVAAQVSTVEKLLTEDPAGIYPVMDLESRAHYRFLLAQHAERGGLSEQTLAETVIRNARTAADPRERHVGNEILGWNRSVRTGRRFGAAMFALNIIAALAGAAWFGAVFRSVWTALVLILPLWEIVRILTDRLLLWKAVPAVIPRLDTKKAGITDGKTAVVISVLLPKVRDLPKLEERLKRLYFANRELDLAFCVLADFRESEYPGAPEDATQAAAAVEMIERLNEQYGARFFLLVRRRSFCKTQNRYSGRERKRGAIEELVSLMRGGEYSAYATAGDPARLREKEFIIALDADTNLPFGTAERMIAAVMHPANRPAVDERRGIVTDGYGILVPRMTTELESANRTTFSKIMAGNSGSTAYDSRTKDLYQDRFGEAIFSGKGIINVEAFHKVLKNRFPGERVLSHDILEGELLRTGYLSDVELSDSFPSGAAAWMARQHRWIRGDWQNLFFLRRRYKVGEKTAANQVGWLSRYKLADNLRRSLLPIASLVCILTALFTWSREALVLVWAGALAVMLPALLGAFSSLIRGGVFVVMRRYFTDIFPRALELLAQAFLMFILLPQTALSALDAIARTLWRVFVSGEKLLEWVTAADSGGDGGWIAALRKYWLGELVGLVMMLSYLPGLRLCGLLFLLALPVAVTSARPVARHVSRLSAQEKERVGEYCARMWEFYEEYAGKTDNFLPPDNMQQAPVYLVAHRTSPTNIGLMLLSVLAARDFDFISTDGLYRRINRTISTVERLPKWHGNLYNWYDTQTLQILAPAFVSTVDSGNFVCCLVALKEGLREYSGENDKLIPLISRVEQLIRETDLSGLYDRKRKLFSIGYDIPSGELNGSYYDFLMSESRMTSYFAIATGQAEKKHWGALSRTMSRNGVYAGPVSWTGTMFEYYMPNLLMPAYENSLVGEALKYCFYCQRKRVFGRGIPWGISESAFYAFDSRLCYQYKAHGVQKLGVKQSIDSELVISPYSAFLALPFYPHSTLRNLAAMEKTGLYADYGFYESADYTVKRVQSGREICRSYMAHHVGMSMISCANALFDGVMQKRFMADNRMGGARELLMESVDRDTVVFDSIRFKETEHKEVTRLSSEQMAGTVEPENPNVTILSNGELTDLISDTGENSLMYAGAALTRKTTDSLRNPHGVYVFASVQGKCHSLTEAPFYNGWVDYETEIGESSVKFFSRTKELNASVECTIHPNMPVEKRAISLRNTSGVRQNIELLIYCEPVLCQHKDYAAHPAFSKLFVTARYDHDSRCLLFERRSRDDKGSGRMCMAAGFLESVPYDYETRREKLFETGNGYEALRSFHKLRFEGGAGTPDCCCAIRLRISLAPSQKYNLTFLMSASRRRNECIASMIRMRKSDTKVQRLAAGSPVFNNTLEGRLAFHLLPRLLYPIRDPAAESARAENTLSLQRLWGLGISGDFPLVIGESFEMLRIYIRVLQLLRERGVEFDLVALYDGGLQPDFREKLTGLLREADAAHLLGARAGVHCADIAAIPEEERGLIRAASVLSVSDTLDSGRNLRDFGRPEPILPVEPAETDAEPDLTVHGGFFAGDRFYVRKQSPMPYCHILANPTFGTLVSDRMPGFTWAVNSRENKLTPWKNDFATDNDGELLLLRLHGAIHSLTDGAQASFSPGDARYEGRTGGVRSTVTIEVSGRGAAKFCTVELQNESDREAELELAYYTEPVLDVSRETAKFLRFLAEDGILTMRNPANTGVKSCAALAMKCVPESDAGGRFSCGRAKFLSGRWDAAPEGLFSDADPCAAAIAARTLAPGEKLTVRFVLSYGATTAAARAVAQMEPVPAEREQPVVINTPDKNLNCYINGWSRHQTIASRLYGRTAFYQNGGAYGFRDQLQDACSLAATDPHMLRQQILRAASVQFPEGDVLHWWHSLPKSCGGLRGVRTRYSDDLLWMPYAVARYLDVTGDAGILDEQAPYLGGKPLQPGQKDHYFAPEFLPVRENIYQHCLRAIKKAYNPGEHGLPLIGCGDWNDGYSAVGAGGKGESVWLGMFLTFIMDRFRPICERRGDLEAAQKLEKGAEQLRGAVEKHAWDGEWYLRAFYDDGSPMGSGKNDECRIDSLPQSFASLAEITDDKEKINLALTRARERLVDERHRLVKLFDGAFVGGEQNPGYVKGYPAGIRENGGQYTHAGIWLAMAMLKEGRTEEGYHLLDLLNPVARSADPDCCEDYKIEPYYMPADVYSNPGCPGRGGWSLYTGAAAWYHTAVTEWLLGMKFSGDRLTLRPGIPAHWDGFSATVRVRGTVADIRVKRRSADGAERTGLSVDGQRAEFIPLDGRPHQAVLYIE